MANYFETTKIRPETFVPATSRYFSSTVVYYTEKKKLTFGTYRRTPHATSDRDRFTTITKGYEYRPDLVSFDAYGTTDFWWKIMEANDIKDILDFSVGRTVRLPNNVLF